MRSPAAIPSLSSPLELIFSPYPIQLFTFRFNTRTPAGTPLPAEETETGLDRARCTPPRPGLAAHLRPPADSPRELLREQGALLTFRPETEPIDRGRPPADWLRVKGQMLRLMLRSALLLRSFFLKFFSWSFSPDFFSGATLNKSFHRLERDDDVEEEEKRMEDGDGDGSAGGAVGGEEGGCARRSVDGRERSWRGRRTPSRNSSSAVRRLEGGKEGLRTIQNSNSGEEGPLSISFNYTKGDVRDDEKKEGEDKTGEMALLLLFLMGCLSALLFGMGYYD
ncbi:hypothetical protein M5K25_005350 [Dendrobium thyrsiflorum]|uniref:Uncharacterized protein n=1 Tax=Dendrobium thyrsiflorum TaxID=117978 RepID=A0ABD0VPN2_DENTH